MLRIEAQRITLRDWRLDDLEPYRIWMQPGQRWQQFDGPYYPSPSQAEIDDRIERLRERIVSDSTGWLASGCCGALLSAALPRLWNSFT